MRDLWESFVGEAVVVEVRACAYDVVLVDVAQRRAWSGRGLAF